MASVGEQVSLERLRQLLDQGESPDLDFKATCDLNERPELVAIIKDIAAFAATGGHLVVGVNENGVPSSLFDETKAKLFDEARLRSKIAPRYLPESVSVATAVHQVDGKPVVIVYLARHPSGFVVMQRDGDYTDAGGKPIRVRAAVSPATSRTRTAAVRTSPTRSTLSPRSPHRAGPHRGSRHLRRRRICSPYRPHGPSHQGRRHGRPGQHGHVVSQLPAVRPGGRARRHGRRARRGDPHP